MTTAALPTLDLEHLRPLLAERSRVPIGYATKAMTVSPSGVAILHHDSIVVILDGDGDTIHLNTHGYGSKTTGNRIDAALVAAGAPWRATIRGGVAVLLDAQTLRVVSTYRTATVQRDAAGWHLLEITEAAA